jgi:hypothetical protein
MQIAKLTWFHAGQTHPVKATVQPAETTWWKTAITRATQLPGNQRLGGICYPPCQLPAAHSLHMASTIYIRRCDIFWHLGRKLHSKCLLICHSLCQLLARRPPGSRHAFLDVSIAFNLHKKMPIPIISSVQKLVPPRHKISCLKGLWAEQCKRRRVSLQGSVMSSPSFSAHVTSMHKC